MTNYDYYLVEINYTNGGQKDRTFDNIGDAAHFADNWEWTPRIKSVEVYGRTRAIQEEVNDTGELITDWRKALAA